MNLPKLLLVPILILLTLTALASNAPVRAHSAPPIQAPQSTTALRRLWTAGGVQTIATRGDLVFGAAGRHILALKAINANALTPIGYSEALPEDIVDLDADQDHIYAVSQGALYILDAQNPQHMALKGVHLSAGHQFYAAGIAGNRAYVAAADGMHIVDIADPTDPVELGQTTNSARDVIVAGEVAYVLTGVSVDVIDVANPASPQIVGVYYGVRLHAFAAADNYLYIVSIDDGILVVDVSDPTAPHEVARRAAYAEDIARHGDNLYLIGAGGIYSFDIADPTDPRLNETFNVSGASGIGVTLDLTVANDGALYASVGGRIRRFQKGESAVFHELSGYGPAEIGQLVHDGQHAFVKGDYLLHILDLHDPALPREIGSLPVGLLAQHVVLGDAVVFLTDSENGVLAIDVTDPTAPRQIARYEIYQVNSIERSADYLYLNTPAGIQVLDVSRPATPQVVTTLAYSGQLARAGDLLLVGDSDLHLFNLANPAAPTHIASYHLGSGVRKLAVEDTTIYLLSDAQEVHILNISDPSNIQKVGEFDRTLIDGNNTFMSQLAVNGDYLAVSDSNLLHLLDVSQPSAPTLLESAAISNVHESFSNRIVNIRRAAGGFYVSTIRAGIHYFRLEPGIETVVPPGGGILAAAQMTATFGPGSFPEETTVSYVPLAADQTPPLSGVYPASAPFELLATGSISQSVSPTQPYTLTVHYEPAGLPPLAESSLQLLRLHPTGWRVEPAQVDIGNDTISASQDNLGIWILAAPYEYGLFLPQIVDNYAATDLYIDRLEVTQHVQRPDNSVPLVAGKRTVLRVFARNAGRLPVHDVLLTVSATRDGQPLPGSPLEMGPWTVYSHTHPAVWGHQYNVALPDDWLDGAVTLNATLEPTTPIVEATSVNNSERVTAQFTQVPPLRLVIVPVHWSDTTSGNNCNAPSEDYISGEVLQTFPIDSIEVTIREPIHYEGDLVYDSGISTLLGQLQDTKNLDGAPGATMYYGLIDDEGELGDFCPMSIGGISGGRSRVAFGAGSGSTAAHEIGHSLGLGHAPCGSPQNPDPDFPYPDGSTGFPIYFTPGHRIITPGAPDFNKDTMTYCASYGFSDYHYEKLFHDQLANGKPLGPQALHDTLYVRVSVGGETPVLLPSYLLRAEPTALPSSSDYMLQLRDAAGNTVATHPLPVIKAQEDNVTATVIRAALPLPDRPVTTITLLHQGQRVDERSLDPVPHAHATLDESAAVPTLRWSVGQPVAIRFTPDHDATWTTVVYDATGGAFPLDAIPIGLGAGQIELRRADALDPVIGLFSYKP